MFGSGRHFLAALAGLAALFTAFGLGLMLAGHQPQPVGAQPYRYAADKPLELDATTALGTKAEPLEYRTPCKQPKGETESDLCAQWRAAQAAENGAYWAKWGFWTGVIGAAGIVAALLLTVESNNIARRSAEKQLRAYIVVSKSTIRLVNGKEPRATIIFWNRGQTPAYDVIVNAKIAFADFPGFVPDGFFEIEIIEESSSKGQVGPNESKTLIMRQPVDWDDDLASHKGAGDLAIYVWGIIRYKDFLGEVRLTEFRLRNDRTTPKTKFHYCEIGNTAT